jgi:hypothetical protein
MIFSIATYGKPAHDNCNKLVTALSFKTKISA